MGGLFSSPSPPRIEPPPPVVRAPVSDDKEVQEAKAEAARRRRRARGFRATIVAQRGDANDAGLRQTLGS